MDWNWLKEFLAREHKAELQEWKRLKGNPITGLIDDGLIVPGTLTGAVFEASDPDASIRFREDDRVSLLPFTESGTFGQAILASRNHIEQADIYASHENNSFDLRRLSHKLNDGRVLLCPSKPLEEEYEALGHVIDVCIDGGLPSWSALLEQSGKEEETLTDNDSLFGRLRSLPKTSHSPLVLVQGPPGAGKTHLIGQLVNEWSEQGMSVLVAAFTNRAVDEMLTKSVSVAWDDGKEAPALFRAGRDKICEKLDIINHARKVIPCPSGVLGTTLFKCATAAAENPKDEFDVAVIDEASQVKLPSLFAVATLAKRVVVVGDHRQLPPVILQDVAKRTEINEYRCSAFEYLVERQHHFMIRETWRLNKHVCAFISNRFYGGKLQSRPEAAEFVWPAGHDDPWLAPSPGVCHIEVGRHGVNPRSSVEEAETVAKLIMRLEAGVGDWMGQNDMLDPTKPPPKNIPYETRYMVSCLFRHQASLVRQAIRRARIPHHLWHVDTVERNQGQTASVAILCVGASTPESAGRDVGWVLDKRRWNVALSRGRYRAYVVSSAAFASNLGDADVDHVVIRHE